MILVMSPTASDDDTSDDPRDRELRDRELADADAATEGEGRRRGATISFDRYKTTMQSSFTRRYDKGAYVFRRGDAVDHFYVITKGTCEVRLPSSELQTTAGAPSGGAPAEAARDGRRAAGSRDTVIASLGPGDFFGETALLEGRSTRAASVICLEPVEVMALDRDVFKQVAGTTPAAKGEGDGVVNKLADSMRSRAEERQQARLLKVFELMRVSLNQRHDYPKGAVVFRQARNRRAQPPRVTAARASPPRVTNPRPHPHRRATPPTTFTSSTRASSRCTSRWAVTTPRRPPPRSRTTRASSA